MNKLKLIGNLGKPAEVKTTNGTTYCRLSLAATAASTTEQLARCLRRQC